MPDPLVDSLVEFVEENGGTLPVKVLVDGTVYEGHLISRSDFFGSEGEDGVLGRLSRRKAELTGNPDSLRDYADENHLNYNALERDYYKWSSSLIGTVNGVVDETEDEQFAHLIDVEGPTGEKKEGMRLPAETIQSLWVDCKEVGLKPNGELHNFTDFD